MAFDEHLADRIRQTLNAEQVAFTEKKMMGGLSFMVNDKMCVGIVKENLMARIGPDNYEAALAKPGIKPMDFTGKPMKGYVFATPMAIDLDDDLTYWLRLSVEFNKTLV